MIEKTCTICKRSFKAKGDRIHTCSRDCSDERNRRASRDRYDKIKSGEIVQAIAKHTTIPNIDSQGLEKPSRYELEVMKEAVMRIFFPLEAQVSDAFHQSSNLGCRGHGVGIASF